MYFLLVKMVNFMYLYFTTIKNSLALKKKKKKTQNDGKYFTRISAHLRKHLTAHKGNGSTVWE